MTKLSRSSDDPNTRQRWESVFDLWWGVSIKYFCPFALWFLLSSALKSDMDKRYGNYNVGWQVIGLAFPVIGLLIFIGSLIFCTTKDEFNPEVDAAFDDNAEVEGTEGTNGNGDVNRVKPTEELEMSAVGQNAEPNHSIQGKDNSVGVAHGEPVMIK